MSVRLGKGPFWYGMASEKTKTPAGYVLVAREHDFLMVRRLADGQKFCALLDENEEITALAPMVDGLADMENKIIL